MATNSRGFAVIAVVAGMDVIGNGDEGEVADENDSAVETLRRHLEKGEADAFAETYNEFHQPPRKQARVVAMDGAAPMATVADPLDVACYPISEATRRARSKSRSA